MRFILNRSLVAELRIAMARPNKCRSKLRGFTLTELAIVLGVIGLILGAIWAAASKVYSDHKVTKAIHELLVISSGIRKTYGMHPSFLSATQTDITCAMVKIGNFPVEMLPSVTCVAGDHTTYPKNPWGLGIIVYSSTNAPDASATQFEIQMAIPDPKALYVLVEELALLPSNIGLTYLFDGNNVGWLAVSGITAQNLRVPTDSNFSSSWKLGGG
jgi:prepilin-type N-terminal cleavage/methylation domain-containing protein